LGEDVEQLAASAIIAGKRATGKKTVTRGRQKKAEAERIVEPGNSPFWVKKWSRDPRWGW